MEKHVTNRIISEKIKELGVKQNGFYCWSYSKLLDKWEIVSSGDESFENEKNTQAFLASEIGNKLQKANSDDFIRAYYEVMDLPYTGFTNYNVALMMANVMCDPNIAGQMLIYLLENKLI